MKLYVQRDFAFPPEKVFEAFLSDAFEDRLSEKTGLGRHIEERSEDGDVTTERVKCSSKNELPMVVAKAMGTKHLTYHQINRVDRAKRVIEWRVELPVMRDKVTIKGRTTCVPHGSGARRTVDGQVDVKVRLIGSRIEKTIVSEFSKSYEQASEIVIDLLSR
jgi:hypothetical protein